MTSIPDWLVERAALDEVPVESRARLAAADPGELAARIAAVRADNAAELAAYPARPAIAQIEARVARRRAQRRKGSMWLLGAVTSIAAIAVAILVLRPATQAAGTIDGPEVTRVKGAARLLVFRLAGDHVEKLEPDALAAPGDIIQLRYNPGGQRHGMIASIDGAGAVTLHHPVSEDASSALAGKTTALPNAYELDDAPGFERFFFITDDEPLDIRRSLDALRELARRDDAATAQLEVPDGMRAVTLRLRKPDATKAKTP